MKIIAEVGSNWRTSDNLDECWSDLMILLDKLSGNVDFVKFQCWNTEKFVHKDHPSFERYKYLELPKEWYKNLINEVESRKMKFMSTPFDTDTADLLKEFGQKYWKVASGDITFIKLIKHLAKFNQEMYISTGNANDWEIKDAVDTIRASKNTKDLTIFHCISKYPTRLYEIGFKQLIDLTQVYDTDNVGWSSHLEFEESKIAASVASTLGINIFEFHVGLGKNNQEYGFSPEQLEEIRRIIFKVEMQNQSYPIINEETLLWDRRNEKDDLRPWDETICKRILVKN
jgi:sialic acid synthase SpsE